MAFTDGNTNRECSFFWDGVDVEWGVGGVLMDGREQKVGRRGCEG